MAGHDWEAHAACRRHDPELWHPEQGGDGGAEARRICRECPVRQQCLAAALAEERHLAAGARHGIRGGHSARARLRIQKKRDQTA